VANPTLHAHLEVSWLTYTDSARELSRNLAGVRLEEIMAETYKGDAYCVKCKEKRDFEGTVKVSDSGRRMAQGICSVCGTKLNRILGKAQ